MGKTEHPADMPSGRPDQQRYLKLTPLHEVRERILASLAGYNCGVEDVPVDAALGRVTAEQVTSDRDIPPVNVAAMDGYAVRAIDLVGASISSPVVLRVEGSLSPIDRERPPVPNLGRGSSYRVATGAPIPVGSDLVVRVEDTKLKGQDSVKVFREFPPLKNVSTPGEDVEKGEVVIKERSIVNPAEIALLIQIGRMTIRVFKLPKVGVLSVGSELKKFKSVTSSKVQGGTYNNYSNLVCGYLEGYGITPTPLGICKDDPADIRVSIQSALEKMDMICTIGGTSVGAADFTPDAAKASTDTELLFHGVRVVPIRPAGMAMARRAGKRQPIVMIPGHSVSAALTVPLLVLPVINLLMGLDADDRRIKIRAVAEEGFQNGRAIDGLVLIELRIESGSLRAFPQSWGSNLLSSLARANGFVHLKPHEKIAKSETIDVELLAPSEMQRIRH